MKKNTGIARLGRHIAAPLTSNEQSFCYLLEFQVYFL